MLKLSFKFASLVKREVTSTCQLQLIMLLHPFARQIPFSEVQSVKNRMFLANSGNIRAIFV